MNLQTQEFSSFVDFIENEYCIRCRSRYDHARDLSQSSTCTKDAAEAHLKVEISLGRMQKIDSKSYLLLFANSQEIAGSLDHDLRSDLRSTSFYFRFTRRTDVRLCQS